MGKVTSVSTILRANAPGAPPPRPANSDVSEWNVIVLDEEYSEAGARSALQREAAQLLSELARSPGPIDQFLKHDDQ